MSAECSVETIPPGYKQTEVGVIPEDWEVKSIGEAFEVHNHLRVPISQKEREKISGKYPYYGPTGIQGYINEYRIEGQYALIGEDGDHFLKWREMPMTLMVSGKFNVNNHAHVVKGTNNLTAWFYYYFSHKDLTQHLTRQGAGRYKLTKKTLLNIQCVLPSPPEQKAITEGLFDTDALIESLEQLIAKKRQIKQGAMQELLTGKRRLPGFSGEWETKLLGNLGNFLKGRGVVREESLTGNLPCIRYGEIYTKHNDYIKEFHSWISRDVAATAMRLSCGDILFAGSGETKEEIGKCVAFIDKMDAYAGGDIVILRPQNVDSLFLGYYLNTVPINQQKASRGQGDAIVHIGSAALADIKITIPSLPEQNAIAAVLSDMDSEITALEEKLAKARQIKQGMMQELLTGRIRLV